MNGLSIYFKVCAACLALAMCAALLSCSGGAGSAYEKYSISTDAGLDSALLSLKTNPSDYLLGDAILRYCTEKGYFDVIIDGFPSVFRHAEAEGDGRMALNCGLYLSQAYLFKDRLDSCYYYLDRVSPLVDSTGFQAAMMHNISAIYAVKAYTGYADALDHFRKAYEISQGDTLNMGVMLMNITTIYLTRRDTSGLHYAEEAYGLALKTSHPYLLFYSAVTLADMLSLAGDYERSLEYAREALGYSLDEGRESLLSTIYLIIASDWQNLGKPSVAEEYYSLAEKYLYCAESGQRFRFASQYGSYMAEKGHYRDAVESFKSGLALPECSSSDSLTLYRKLSDAYLDYGDESNALEAYKKYHYLSDSLSLNEEERRFNDLLMKYEMAKYENSANASELKLVKANRRTIIFSFAFAIAALSFVGLWLLSRRKNQMYRQLVEQHQSFMKREKMMLDAEDAVQGPEEDSSLTRSLWERILKLMNEQKAYRRKDISVEWLATALDTNRSYVSKAINSFSGMTFYNYINYLRVNDAISVLSSKGDDTPLKSLADDLGYNSLSTFYKAFQKETGCPPSRYREQIRKISPQS